MKKHIGLFITCLADNFYPRSGIAMVKILEYLGYEVGFPVTQTCCGQPLYNNGYFEDAQALARKFVNEFAVKGDFDYVVMPSGSCASMVRNHYKELIPGDGVDRHEDEDVEFISQRTFEFIEFLLRFHKNDMRNIGSHWHGGPLTFHYSCHYRGLGVKLEEIEDFIKAIAGVEYHRLNQVEQCCGFGGTFSINYPTVSGSMVEDKVKNILVCDGHESGNGNVCGGGGGGGGGGAITNVICNDSGCTLNISGAFNRIGKGQKVRFLSLAELIAENLGLMDKVFLR